MKNFGKRLLSFAMALFMVLSLVPFNGLEVYAAGSDAVAKVGNTEYATIDEAIASWTNGSTLALLADVTLSDVIKLNSTEYHVLDLGTFTMTAASKKDAIQIENCGRSSASYALDIKADAIDPGGITASGKSVVVTTGKSGVKDRPIIRFYNGVFNASYVVKHSGSNGTNCPQFYFYDGVFNGTISTNRALNQFYGGTFTGSLMMSVDSSAYTLISGGTFKNLSNLYGSALNSGKFTIGSAKGVYDKEIYVDDNGCYVVANDEPADGFEAEVAKNPGTNDYLAYSKVATEGVLKYTDAKMALEKNNTASAKVTIYAEEIDLAGVSYKGTIVAPEGKTLKIRNAPEGLKTEGNVTIVKPVAAIGDQSYNTLQAAVDAAVVMGGNVTVTLTGDVTENVTVTEKTGLYLTIDGAEKTMNGTITVKALSDTNDNRRTTIQNVNFVNTGDTGVDFIISNETNHYPRLTVADCSFTGNGKDTDVALRTKSAYGMTVENCSGTGLHSFLQNTAGVTVTVKGVTVTDSKGGLAMGTAQNVTISGCDLTTRTYGIRLDAVLDTAVTLTDNFVSAYIPVSVRKATATEYNLTVSGENSMTVTNTDSVWCAICATEYEDGVALNAPTGAVYVTLDDADLDKAGVYGAYKRPATGTITYGFTSQTGIWGETQNNASESMVIELYYGDTKIASSQLNNIDGIIDGDVFVTWQLPFAGSNDAYWTVEWAEGYPNKDAQPTKVVLVVDGTAVAENAVQMNGPDNLNPVVWKDLDFFKVPVAQTMDANGNVIGSYFTFEEALAAVENGQTIVLANGATGDESSKEIEFTKDIDFTITGKAPAYALPVVTFQNATVTIKDAQILIPELDARQNATINVVDSTVYDAGGNSIIKSYYNGAINISGTSVVYTMQVTTMGYITVSDTAKLNATWQTNVYGNGLITVKDDATFATAALQLTGKEYSGRDNTDENRVGQPATIVVDGANFIVGSVKASNGADYSYNSSSYGINIGTIAGKAALLDIKNGATVQILRANGEAATVGADGTVLVDGSTLNGVNLAGAGTTKFYNTVNFNGANAVVTTGLGGTPFELVVNKGATLNITRFVLGYDRAITVYGEIEDAHSFDPAGKTPSLKFNSTSGVSIGGTDTGRLTVQDAYIELGNSSWKSSQSVNTWSFKNSYVSAASFGNNNAKSAASAAWNVMFDDSVLAAKNYIKTGDGVTYNFTNGSVATTGSIRIDGGLYIDETSSVTTTSYQNNKVGAQDEHGDITGTVTVDGTLTIGSNAALAVELRGGELKIGKNGKVDLTKCPLNIDADSKLVIDAEGMGVGEYTKLIGSVVNNGTIEVINNNLVAEIVDGKVFLKKKPVASVDGVEYADLISALKAIKANSVVEILSDVTINEKWDVRNTGAKITVPVTINGNGHTIAFNGVVNDGYNYYSAFRFEAAATVTDLTIDMTNAKSEFQGRFRAISAKSDLTVDGCTFIGNGSANNTRAIIFGEGAGDAIGNVVITITDSTFTGWRQGVSDNEQGKQEVKSVTITGNTFTDAGVNVSAAETINFNNNTVDGRWVKLVSYVSKNLTVNAQGNTLTPDGADSNIAKGAILNVQDEFLPPVAEVNGVTYKTLQAAFKAAGKNGNVTLVADVDLNNEEWTPIETFSGIFDGNGYTIKNLKITHPGDQTVVNNVGLIGTLENGTIKNLTIENVNITGSGKVGAVAGNGYTGKIENVTVKGNIQIAGYQYVGGITGYGYASIDNCHVIGDGAATSVIKKVAKSEIYGSGTNGYVGGIKGFSGEGNIKVINSSVSNITITTNDDTVGGISGIFHYGNTFAGCELSNMVISAPDNDGYNGIIAGDIRTTKGQVNTYEVTVNNVTATADGVALPTLGTGAVMVEDTSAGNVLSGTVYDKSVAVAKIGNTYYKDLHEAMVACKAGETVLLIADVDLAGTEWEPVSFKGTFDGQNHTISNLTINKPGVSNTGFITSLNGTFKNVTFTNPTVTGGENTGVVAGRAGGSAALAENITVNGTIKVETTHSGYARAGVIVGGWAYGNYKNITVDGGDKAVSYIKHTGGGDGRYVGGIVGHADDVDSYVNCTVKNITIDGGWLCGAIAGPGPSDGLASGCVVENVNMNADYSGGMFGWYFGNGTIEDSTIKDVAFTAGTTKNGAIGGYGANPSANVVNVTIENVTNQGKALLEHVAEINGTYYFSLEEAFAVAKAGDEVKILAAGTYALTTSGKDITITGAVDGVVFDNIGAKNMGGANVTFNNVTFDYYPNVNYTGLQHSGNLVYNNCTFNGQVFLYGQSETFNNCTFNTTDANNYNVWTYSAKEVAFNECTFNCAGKSVLVYNEGAGATDLTVTDSTFTASQAVEGKAAIEIDTTAMPDGTDIVINNSTATGFGTGSISGNSLWNDKKDQTDLTVTVDGVKVWPKVYVAQIGDTKYETLAEAMVACKAGETVLLIADVDLAGTEWEPVSFKGTFDGQNHTISNLTINKPGVSNTGFITSLNGTFKNVTFTNPTVTGGENTGVVAGRAGGSAALAENITVNGTIKVETTHSGYARAGVIVGGWAYGNYKNITVDGGDKAVSYIKHTGGGDGRYVGGIVGHADDVDSYVNCTVKNITIDGGWLCGAIAGPGPSDGLASGCVVENVNMNADYSGGMFGWYFGNGTIENSTIKDVAFTAGTTKNGAIGGYSKNTDANVVNVTIENVTNQGKALLEHVAEINGTYYFNLQVAFKAVEEGQTIQLLAGTISEGTVKLPATLKNVTLKGAEGAILKDMTIMAADGNAISYEGLTFDGITFENSRITITGWRNGGATVKDLTVTNCTFKNLDDTTNGAPVHINMAAAEAVENFTFTNNVIDGATGGQKSGVYAQTTGKTVFTGNTINNVSFRPYVIQITTDDGIADEFIVTDNTFSGSAAGRAQGLGNNAEGTDTVKLVVSENIIKDSTTQQICYWNFNEETTTADLSKNYYDIDILNNPAKIYYNGAAQNAADLIEMGVFPYYADEAKTQLVEAPAIMVTYPVGNPVYPEGKVEYYQNLLDAVPYTTNCPRLEGAIVTLLMDIEAPGIRMMENDMVLDLNGHTYTITTGTGSQGTNTSGFQIRPEVTTVATIKNGTIQVAEGAPVVWMFNNYATNFVVEDVIVDCANMAYSYGESCYVHVSRAGDNTQFTGNTQIINFNSEVAGDAINVGGTMTMEETVVPGGSFVLDVGATLTAPANLDVTALEGYKVAYENGVYSLVEITYVAQIGNTKYETFEEALDAAKAAGMTEVEVTLLADCKFSTKVKNFTKVTVKGTDRAQTLDLNLNAVVELGNVELVFEDLTVSRLDKEWLYHWFYAGKITYRDCKMIGQFNVSAQDTDFIGCDFYNDDSFGDGNYSLWVYNCLEGIEVNVTDCTFDVYERAIKMFGDGYTGNMVLNISGTEFTSRTADKTVVEIAQAQNCSNGSFTLNVTDSTYTGFGAYEHTGNDTENTLFNVEVGSIGGDVKVFKDTVQLWPLNYVAQNVTTGKSYATLQGAIDEAAAGDIITVIADISGETVTVDKSITITGEKRLTDVSITGSNGCELTVSGLTFEGKSWINAGSASKLTVSDVTATNVAPANSATTNSRNAFISLGRNEAQKLALVVENSEIYCTNSGDAINGWAQLTSATISGNTFGSESKYNNGNNVIKIMSVAENAQITFAGNTVYANWNGFAVAPNNTRGNAHTIVVENNTFVGGADFIWIETQNATYTYATVKATGNNTINGAAFTAADIKTDENTWYYYGGVNVELDAEGKLIGGTFNAQSNKELVASGYEAVENADGTWTVVPSEKYVAWNLQTQEKYETVAAALTAATSGQTVQMLADSDEATSILLILNGITLDLNGKQLTALYAITTASEAGIIDSANAQGLLKVAKANLSIHDNAQLPVWIEEEAGFRFATVAPRQLAPTTSNGAATYTFYVSRNNTSAIFGKELADGAGDGDGLSVTIKMYYTDRNGQEQMLNFTPPAETLKKYAATWYDESQTLMGITMTVYGIDTISNVSFQTVYAYGATEVASDRISLNAE